MTLDTFFEKFDLFADAPYAVAKMRGLILRLAMQGKLSESHKTDGPVSELLREVEKDKMRLGFVNSARATSVNSDFSDDETSDAIPARWAWKRFGNIARHNAGKTLDKGRNRGELRDYITTSNLYWGFLQLESVRQMPMLDDELERCTAIKGDLLICEGGEAGRAAVWPHDSEISFQNHVHRARFFAGINPYFVQRYLEKLNATGEIEKYRKGVGISNMSGKALASIPIPLPPLAEQKRIVAKVDELMALCDRLEAQQQERETRHAALARASLARFADAPTPANLPFLFHPSYAIPPADLRKSILTLAPRGQLVEQRESEGVAEPNSEVPFSPEELPYDRPAGWVWKRLGDLVEFIGGSQPPKSKFIYEPRDGYTRFIQIRDFKSDANLTFIPTTLANRPFKEDDVMIGRYGPPVFQILRGLSGTYNVALMKAEPISKLISKDFLFYLLLEPRIQDRVIAESDRTAGQSGVRKPLLHSFVVAIPPLAEQRRIVAKVEQLMALVDALEMQLAASRATAANLLSALVAELTGTRHTGKVSVPATTTTGRRGRPRKSA
jgi:type I restriction enzyme S subunit